MVSIIVPFGAATDWLPGCSCGPAFSETEKQKKAKTTIATVRMFIAPHRAQTALFVPRISDRENGWKLMGLAGLRWPAHQMLVRETVRALDGVGRLARKPWQQHLRLRMINECVNV